MKVKQKIKALVIKEYLRVDFSTRAQRCNIILSLLNTTNVKST